MILLISLIRFTDMANKTLTALIKKDFNAVFIPKKSYSLVKRIKEKRRSEKGVFSSAGAVIADAVELLAGTELKGKKALLKEHAE